MAEHDIFHTRPFEITVRHRIDDRSIVEHLPVPGVLLKQIRTLEGFNIVCHSRMAEVETVGDESRPGHALGDAGKHAVVLIALEPMRNQDNPQGPPGYARWHMTVSDDGLAIGPGNGPGIHVIHRGSS